MEHKSGFVNIIGNPNVGKSTLMNALVGERISIITSKAQTTRHRIMGIVNGEDFQIVYSDTPGVLNPQYKLQESMMNFVKTALTDADIILFVTDIFEEEMQNEEIFKKVQHIKVPVLLLLNKIDLTTQDKVEEKMKFWKERMPNAEVIPVSALERFNTEKIFQMILDNLPLGEPFYPKDQLTDKPERFFVSEAIREKIFLHYKKEIPYSSEVVVDTFKEDENIIRIRAEIIVARDSQKGIIIGHKGLALKRVGVEARKDLEAFFQKQIHLELFVKVKKDWKDDQLMLRRFGYDD
ncbi:MAG: GTPase Era [Bacteroidetes bacterium]|nr:GTPase Era [Bacteroidota bacterium]HET6243880.1 GTPase Era [Bacteroidia bacterium]